MTTPHIILNNISFRIENTRVKFEKLNLSFENLKYGIVGQNGIGKSTFLKLLLGELTPDSGVIQRLGDLLDVPQSHSQIHQDASISDVLGTTDIIRALDNINNGSTDPSDFEIAEHHWDLEKRIADALDFFKLWPIDLDTLFSSLSGGQKTKVLLAKTLIFPADFLIFDEPTNNLDSTSRHILYHYINQSTKGMLIVSHDRKLLNKCNRIIEINKLGIDIYRGNYDFYKEQKEIKLNAIQEDIQARTEILTKSKQLVQTRRERHQQNEARGRKGKITQIKAKGNYDKIELKSKKGRSEKTNRRIQIQADRKLEAVTTELTTARAQLEVQEDLNICLSATAVPNNKIVLNIENLFFNYHKAKPLIKNFGLQLIGPTRVAIHGPNGCGKSTLIKLINGALQPSNGKIFLGVKYIAYLDQSVSFLKPDLSLVDNFLMLNPNSKPFDAYSALAAFKFRNKDAEKKVSILSGGERIRAGLAISLMSKHPPQLLILDEPSNYLDLDAIQAIEDALKLYQGAILAISHDDVFLKNIGITQLIELAKKN